MRVLALCVVFIYLLTTVPGVHTPHPAPDDLAHSPATSIDQLYARFDTVKTSLTDYSWPTDASQTITSTFGEYRKTHFHAGIDISTYNRTGYKVFAARDGYVWRINISHTGYGKVLYLKHDDGYITTYAHLKTFTDTINTLARAEQFRLERYPIDITLDSSTLRVRKGDLVAYSGNSGIGSPHLHFEIRDENFNPVNPQLFHGIARDDNLLPHIYSMAVIPIDEHSRVFGKRQAAILSNITGQKGDYRLTRPIHASGKIGLAVNVRDRVDGTYHRVGIHRLELHLNDSLAFSAQLDRLPADESKQILLFYNLPLAKAGKGRFQHLFVEHNTSLPVYERRLPGAGIIDAQIIDEGSHSFTIVCKDIRGNATRLSGSIALSHPREKDQYLVVGRTAENPRHGTPQDDIFTIPPARAGWYSFDSDTFQVVYDSGAVFKPLNIRVEKDDNGTPSYRLTPQDVLLNKGVRVYLRSSQPHDRSKALYVRNNHRFELRPTSFDSTTGYYTTPLTYTLGDVAVLQDSAPPHISSLRFNLKRRQSSVRFRVSDELSGIDANEIKTYIDDQFVIPEIDDRWNVECTFDRSLEQGTHRFTVVVKDKVGNRSTMMKIFAVP